MSRTGVLSNANTFFELCDRTGRQVLGCNEGNHVITHLHSLTAQPHAECMKAFPFYYA